MNGLRVKCCDQKGWTGTLVLKRGLTNHSMADNLRDLVIKSSCRGYNGDPPLTNEELDWLLRGYHEWADLKPGESWPKEAGK